MSRKREVAAQREVGPHRNVVRFSFSAEGNFIFLLLFFPELHVQESHVKYSFA